MDERRGRGARRSLVGVVVLSLLTLLPCVYYLVANAGQVVFVHCDGHRSPCGTSDPIVWFAALVLSVPPGLVLLTAGLALAALGRADIDSMRSRTTATAVMVAIELAVALLVTVPCVVAAVQNPIPATTDPRWGGLADLGPRIDHTLATVTVTVFAAPALLSFACALIAHRLVRPRLPRAAA
jgi:hypothetical protein